MKRQPKQPLRVALFHSGDVAVQHPDGFLEIRDRIKDIIISGGENISSIEVESVLYRHPAVSAAAVVAKPDEKWGETPCAFVELKAGMRRHGGRVASSSAANILQASKCQNTICLKPCPKPPLAKSKNTNCANARKQSEHDTKVYHH